MVKLMKDILLGILWLVKLYWLFDVDSLTISMNYVPVAAGNKTNGPKDCEGDVGMNPTEVDENEASDKNGKHDQEARSNIPVSNAGPSFDTAVPSTAVNTTEPSVSTANESEEQLFERFSPFKNAFTLPPVPNISSMDNTGFFENAYDDEDVEEEVDMNNVISSYTVPDTSFTKFHNDHPEDQVYVDDIIFGSTKKEMSIEFAKLMHDKFQMSSMGELSFFLGLQTANTPMETNKALIKDKEAEDVDVHLYRSMIGSLIYLKGQPKLGLWYLRDSRFDLEAFSDSDYARASLDIKSTIGSSRRRYGQVADEAIHKKLGDRMERAATTASSLEAEQDSGSGPRCQDTILGDVDAQTRFETTSKQSNDPPLLKVNTFRSGEDSMQLMELMTHYTTLSALLGDMSHHNKVYVNPSHTKKFFDNIKREGKDFSRRITPLFDTMMVQASEEVGKDSDHPTNSNPIPIVDKPSTSSQPKQKQKSKGKQRNEAEVLDLEKAKFDQAIEIAKRMHPNRGGEIKDIDADAESFGDDEVFVEVTTIEEEEQSTKTGEVVTTVGVEDSVAPTIPTTVEETLAQTLMEIKAAKPKAKGMLFS
ncbi:hypothetical protein Tco_0874434 [Tanacetum coccineum]|uniref:Uncharacterized protein n=1 Tax=Tanacetum coccineum TaxID=301880 RepID=A0ABQ5BMC8_9ASTR